MKFILFTIALVAVAFASQRSKKDHSVINVPASSSHQAFSYRWKPLQIGRSIITVSLKGREANDNTALHYNERW